MVRARRLLFAALLGTLIPTQAPATPAAFVVAAEYFSFIPGDADKPVPELTITRGSSLTLLNIDPIGGEHSVTADDDVDGVPIFDSALIDNPGQTPVLGVADLPPGDYGFHCQIHWYVPMRGILHVIE